MRLALFAGIVNRHQQRVIDFLVEENKILKAMLGKKRVHFDDDQRRRLAILGRALGRDLLDRFASMVTPETILRWHRGLVAMKWAYASSAEKRRSRPRVMEAIEQLVVKMAKENATKGLKRIQGARKAIGHQVARSTIAKILERNCVAPSPDRNTSWATFLKAHAARIAAADFPDVEVWTLRGLRTFMVVFAIRHHSRKVEVPGIKDAITEEFPANAAKSLLDVDTKPMNGITHLILDRDAKFTSAFEMFVERAGVEIVLTPPRSPNCNAIAERLAGTLRRELLNRIIFFGEAHLRPAVSSFVRQSEVGRESISTRRIHARRSRSSRAVGSTKPGMPACG